MNRNNGIKVIEAILGLMDLVLLMPDFCLCIELALKSIRLCAPREKDTMEELVLPSIKKSICCSFRRISISLCNQLAGISYLLIR